MHQVHKSLFYMHFSQLVIILSVDYFVIWLLNVIYKFEQKQYFDLYIFLFRIIFK